MAKRLDPELYPLAWEASYDAKGAQWRGTPNYSKMLGELDLTGQLLELGIGNGNTVSNILIKVPRDAQLLCVDIARGALRTLPPALRADARIGLLQSDVRTLPFKCGVFSAVFACHILTHMLQGDEARLLSEVKRTLKNGGRVLVEAFTPGDMRFGTGDEVEPNTFLRADGLITRFYDEKEVHSALRESGLNIVSMETVSRAVRYGGERYSRESLVAVAEKPS